MLLGEHEHSLDDKNRLTLPARHREELGDRVVVSRGLDGCLYVHSAAEWDRLRERVRTLDPFESEARTMRRWFFASASEAELDRQGRLVIPAPLLRHAGITREVTVLGVDDHLEVWDRAAWQEQQQRVEGRAEDVAQRLANRD
ncbi:MAG TPA: division/cell wall cluster transcriptional repressor MraZ [Gaiellaceae bacterium]|nr:division/cell wall cluster transcriptional repressor MraZ [Gaiellaceae bacterium]